MSTLTTDLRQGLHAGIAYKAPVRVATTAAITLSGLQTIDSVALATGDRVLVKNQANGAENGIYDANTSSWTRSVDFNGVFDIVRGTQVRVNEGTANGTLKWSLTTADPITIGTTSLAFSTESIVTHFPNVNAPVTATDEELNFLVGVTSAVQANANWVFTANKWLNTGNTQPAFLAYLSADQTADNVLIFNTELFDQGSCYNSSTGKFVAPVTGLYHFSWGIEMYVSTGARTYDWSLKHASTFFAGTPFEIPNLATTWRGGSAAVRLTAADDVYLVGEESLTANLKAIGGSGANTYFSGHLIA